MADWSDSLVALTTPYADLLPRLRDRDKDVATGFQVGTPANLPENTLRFNATTGRMERWESGAWVVKVVALAGGGTGAATASSARANMGAGATGDALFTAATASAARATLGAGATGDALFTAATASAARTTLGATSVGTAVFTAADAAAARAAIAAFGTAGGDLTGNVAILAQSGADSQLRIDGDLAAGRRTILLMRRGGQNRLLLWVGEAETGSNAGSNAELYTYDDGGGAQRVWHLVRATRVQAFDAIPEGPAADPSTANQLARKAYVDAQRDTRVAKAGDTLSGVLLFPFGSAAAPSISFDGDPDTGIFRAAADNLQIAVGGQSVFRVTTAFVQTTQRLALPANAVNPLDAVPKQQLDAAIAGVPTGPLEFVTSFATNSAAIYEITGLAAGYDYLLVGKEIGFNNNVTMITELGWAGPNWATAGYVGNWLLASGSSVTAGPVSGHINLEPWSSTTTRRAFELWLINPNDATQRKLFFGRSALLESAAAAAIHGCWNNTTVGVDRIRFRTGVGTFNAGGVTVWRRKRS